jgi:hypothetical protein
MQDESSFKSPEPDPTADRKAEVVFGRRVETAVPCALPLRSTTSHQSRAFDPCRGVPNSGASLRGTEAIDPKTAHSAGHRRALRTLAKT